ISIRSNFRKSRLLQLSFIDNVLNETIGSEFSVGFGYEIKGLSIGGGGQGNRRGGRTRGTPSRAAAGAGEEVTPIVLNFNMSVRDDNSVIHQLDQLTEATSIRGLRTIRINPSVDYQINKQMTLRFFYDYSKTVPYVTTSFPITVHNGGIVIRFTF